MEKDNTPGHILCVGNRNTVEIRAENATVTFGSNYYTATDNETFPIGVYLNGDSKIGTYEVKISYDNRRLEYTGGGDSEENGVITLSGTRPMRRSNTC